MDEPSKDSGDAVSDLGELLRSFDSRAALAAGERAYAFAEAAYPLCRSITGDGVRQTLELLRPDFPELEVIEVPSGAPVLDWTVPNEWNLRRAWIKGPDGKMVVDSENQNLHVLSYCTPIHSKVSLEELQEHLFSLPDQPDVIPYRTSYWKEQWGFCMEDRRRRALPPGEYEVFVDATLEPGHLTYGEIFVPGETDHEVLLSAHICHPSLANDNLSGIGVVTELARLLKTVRRAHGYRIVLVPGTIGAITWLARNEGRLDRIKAGLVAANLGDGGDFHFKRSRRGTTVLDRAVEKVLREAGQTYGITDFIPFGYDERQYCSSGFDLPVGLLSRSPWGSFPEYHTSADDLDFIRPEHLGLSVLRYLQVAHVLEDNKTYRNLCPKGEPQLGRRGLYGHIGGGEAGRDRQLALLWVLNQSDGRKDLLAIAERAGLRFTAVAEAARALLEADLLVEVGAEDGNEVSKT